jgi:hypothetical protein
MGIFKSSQDRFQHKQREVFTPDEELLNTKDLRMTSLVQSSKNIIKKPPFGSGETRLSMKQYMKDTPDPTAY